ncbi:diguanylate cyclase domain-containing protein [Frisingicoccus sp.]
MKLKFLHSIPEDIKDKFQKQSEKNSWKIMTILSILTLFMQALNMCHVLFLSSKKLGTLNNRIYFGFYCFLFCACALFLIVRYCFIKTLKHRTMMVIHTVFYILWMLWGILLNYYELTRSPQQNLSVIIICILGVAICIQYSPLISLLISGIGALIFGIIAAPIIEVGGLINILAAVVMAFITAHIQFSYKIAALKSQKIIEHVNENLRDANKKLDASLQKFQLVVEQIDNILFDWNLEKNRISFSKRWQKNFGYNPEVTEASKWFSEIPFLSPNEKEEILQGIHHSIQNHELFETEVPIENKHGKIDWYLLRFHPQTETDGSVKSGIGFLTNIQKQKEALAGITEKIYRDALTGTLNRIGMKKAFDEARAQKLPPLNFAALLIDLDNFKQVNDTYGHPCGDAVPLEAARVFRSFFAESGHVGRIGGDEFMILCQKPENLKTFKENLQLLENHGIFIWWKSQEIHVKFSAGCIFSKDGDTYDLLYQKADQALYRAKKLGKGRYYIEES